MILETNRPQKALHADIFSGRKLRISVMLDDWRTPFWVADIIDELVSHPKVEIIQVILNTEPAPARPSLLTRLFARKRLSDLFGRLDQRRSAVSRSKLPDRDLTKALDGVPVLRCLPLRKKKVHFIDEQTCLAIKAEAPNVIWRVGFSILRGNILEIAPYGMWSYHHGDSSRYRGGPPGFWEVYEGALESAVTLQVLISTLDGGPVIGKAYVRTHPSSPDLNFLQLEQAGARLIMDGICRLLTNQWSPTEFFAQLAPATEPKRRFYTRASNWQMVQMVLRRVLPSFVRTRLGINSVVQWNVGIAPWLKDDQCGSIRAKEATWMSPSQGSFLADPFLWRRNDQWHVFVEEFVSAKNRGHISVASWSEESGFGPLVPALVEDFHLSYPFLFEYDGKLLMMPERHMGSDLWAYECTEYPHQWTKYRPVHEGVPCVDATLFERENRWWLFFSRVTGEVSEDNLYACHAPTPFGPWTLHTMNPIRSGLRGSRMAGNFFRSTDGRLVRPAQDCSRCYGGSLVFYEVIELTPSGYGEKEIAATTPVDFPPPWNLRCHTFNITDKWVVFDACRRTSITKP